MFICSEGSWKKIDINTPCFAKFFRSLIIKFRQNENILSAWHSRNWRVTSDLIDKLCTTFKCEQFSSVQCTFYTYRHDTSCHDDVQAISNVSVTLALIYRSNETSARLSIGRHVDVDVLVESVMAVLSTILLLCQKCQGPLG